ncbi:unnamed protein product [Caenorhabditis auriculariae]|uniref:Guanylate cyclase n=1 Tax=Caenorhabditis auriculariae TaxID=2777116 RepID=A0A8S1H8J4_9PELO|nr:unnamed protein product [Caenorhabditis auriculariae]
MLRPCWAALCLIFPTVSGLAMLELENRNISFPLKIDYLAPFSCAVTGDCDDQGAAYMPATLKLALQKVNSEPSWEYFHNCTVKYIDTTTSGPKMTRDATEDLDTVGIMGLSEDCYIDSTILNINGKIGVSDAVLYFLNLFNWSNIAIISPSTSVTSYDARSRSQMIDLLLANSINILFDSRIDPSISPSELISRVANESQRARIFVVVDPTKNASLLRKYIYSLGSLKKMQSGAYFVIGFVSYDTNSEWLESNSPNDSRHFGASGIDAGFNITEDSITQIYRNLIVLSDAPPPTGVYSKWDDFRQNVMDTASQTVFCPPFCNGKRPSILYNIWPSPFLTLFLTEPMFITRRSFMSFCSVAQLTVSPAPRNSLMVFGNAAPSMQVYNFFWSSSRSAFALWACGKLAQLSLLDTQMALKNYSEPLTINFINGTPPIDVPECGFFGERCGPPPNYTFIIVISSVAGLLILLLIAAFFLFRRYRYERRLHALSFLIDRKNIVLKKHVNLMSQQSLRSMASMTGSFIEPQALNNSHFLLDDYRGEEGTGTQQDVLRKPSMEVINESSDPNATTEDLRWHNLPDFAVGLHQGQTIGLKRIYRNDIDFTRNIRLELSHLMDLSHANVIGFVGMVVQAPDVFIVAELAQRGSLKDILDNDELPLDELFMNQMTKDIVSGLEYLHQSPIGCHGRLKSTNCLIDSRWTVRLSSFGLREMRGEENPIREGIQEGKDELWTAPELLRWSTGLAQCSHLLVQKADVYSFAIVLYEIFGRAGPWGEEPMEPRQIVSRVKNMESKKPFRPDLAVLKDTPLVVQETVPECWSEDPLNRPSVGQIRRKIRILTAGLKRTIMDNMVAMIEKYTAKLEKDIAERNEELAKEKEKSDMLLQMMLPDVVAESLKRGERVTAEQFNSVTVFFSDCPGFADLSATSEPIEIVVFLNDLYTCFDNILTNFDVYKVETIADAYMVASGLPLQNGPHHAGEIASLGLTLLKAVENFEIRHRPGEKVRLRIGMNSGAVVAGVIGLKMPRYCLFGDTVNTASRMESNGIPLRVNCSESSKQILEQLGGYDIEERGLIEMKGKGKQMTYFVKGEDAVRRRDRILKERVKYSSLKNALVEDKKLVFE